MGNSNPFSPGFTPANPHEERSMRYIKVLLLVVLFFLVMMFFVQNQQSFSQTMPLKLDLLFIPPVESAPLPFYTLIIICFVLGGLCVLGMLMWDRITLSAKLTMACIRARGLEKDLQKSANALDALQKKLEATEAKAKEDLAAAKAIAIPADLSEAPKTA